MLCNSQLLRRSLPSKRFFNCSLRACNNVTSDSLGESLPKAPSTTVPFIMPKHLQGPEKQIRIPSYYTQRNLGPSPSISLLPNENGEEAEEGMLMEEDKDSNPSLERIGLFHKETALLSLAGPIELKDVQQYQNIDFAHWQYPNVQAWIRSWQPVASLSISTIDNNTSNSSSSSTTSNSAEFEDSFEEDEFKNSSRNLSGQVLGMIEMKKEIFGSSIVRHDIIARCLKYEKSWQAAGTASSKSLSQVRGSSKKAFPQKGRGKARVGSIRAPQIKGGYTVHGPRPANKTTDIQTKVYNAGIRAAISAKFHQDQLIIVDRLCLGGRADKEVLRERLAGLGLEGKKVYFMYGAPEPPYTLVTSCDMFTKRFRSERLPKGEKKLLISPIRHVSVYALLEYDYLVLDKEAVEGLEEMYKP